MRLDFKADLKLIGKLWCGHNLEEPLASLAFHSFPLSLGLTDLPSLPSTLLSSLGFPLPPVYGAAAPQPEAAHLWQMSSN